MRSIIIDECCPSIKERKPYIEIAKECDIKQIRCVNFVTDINQCVTNNSYRKFASDIHMSEAVTKKEIYDYFIKY